MIIQLFLCIVLPVDDQHLSGLLARLDDAEREQAARFAFGRSRRSYVAAHVLLRHALNLAAGRRAWRFTMNTFGKPSLDPPCNDIHFNLSHTDGLVAVALTRGRDVGVDVEAAFRDPDETIFSSYILAAEEIADLDGLADRPGQMLRLWVAKEAIVKAIGVGLLVPPKQIILRGEVPRLVSVPQLHGPPAEWWLLTERYGQHWLALAARFAPVRVERVEMTVTDLLKD
jgi:4'-phosphopantetheinyl transferase